MARQEYISLSIFPPCVEDKLPQLCTISPANEWTLIHMQGGKQVAHQQGCRVEHGRQRGTVERRSNGWGQKEGEEIERVMVEEAQGHSLLQRQRRKWENERSTSEKCGVHDSMRMEKRGERDGVTDELLLSFTCWTDRQREIKDIEWLTIGRSTKHGTVILKGWGRQDHSYGEKVF